MNVCLDCKQKNHCCINLPSEGYVTINLDEAKMIKDKTGLDYSDFLTFTKLPEELVIASRDDYAGTEARFRSGMMLNGRILRLKIKDNNECVFFEKGKCGIYHIRPTICQMYPYWFKKTRQGVIELIVHQGCDYCKLIDEIHQQDKLTLKQKNELIITAKKIIKQKEYYKKHIKEFITQQAINY
ncbi:MAG: YkgJ family cysteine cluster protein [Candidatus Nanoarchaeia archaeon]|jgi:Fe-S-cluster containining protein